MNMNSSISQKISHFIGNLRLLWLIAIAITGCDNSRMTPQMKEEEHQRLFALFSQIGQHTVDQILRSGDKLACFLGRNNDLPTQVDTHGYRDMIQALLLPDHWLVPDGHWTLILISSEDKPRFAEFTRTAIDLGGVADLCVSHGKSFTVDPDRYPQPVPGRVFLNFK